MKKRILLLLVVFGLTLLGSAQILPATSILYEATSLGGTSWELSYWVSDFTFAVDYGFTLFFDYGLYENITPVSASADWDVLVWEPDVWLGPGAYDALALVDDASLSEPFVVSFNWLGSGTPRDYTQSFEIYYLGPEFEILEAGTTATASAPVPEPGTLFLLGSGIAALLGCRRISNQV